MNRQRSTGARLVPVKKQPEVFDDGVFLFILKDSAIS